MIKIVCDMCKEELDPNKEIGYISIKKRESIGGEDIEDDYCHGMHFCTGCMSAIKEFLKRVPQKAPKPVSSEPTGTEKPTATEEKKPKKRHPIDYGKIMALKRAGWDNAKIADEMGMTKASVATAISTYKKKMAGGVMNAVRNLWTYVKEFKESRAGLRTGVL